MDSELWDDEYRTSPEMAVVPDRLIADETADGMPARALDLGCGSGPNALMLAERGWSVVGIDWSQKAIELALAAAQERELDARFEVGDITAWQSDERFDLVISTYSLPSAEGGEKVLQNATAALAPGGTLIVVEWDECMADVWHFSSDELWSVDRIVSQLSGLEIVSAETRYIPDMFSQADDPRAQAGPSATIVFVRARNG